MQSFSSAPRCDNDAQFEPIESVVRQQKDRDPRGVGVATTRRSPRRAWFAWLRCQGRPVDPSSARLRLGVEGESTLPLSVCPALDPALVHGACGFHHRVSGFGPAGRSERDHRNVRNGTHDSAPAAGRRSGLSCALRLNRRARHRAVRTEDAAITRLWPQHGPATGAFVKELAGVDRHRFRFRGGAVRAGNYGSLNHVCVL
jgi:hypothetical protein